jgi:hypothetical protein
MVNQAAHDAGLLAHRLSQGYNAHKAALQVASDPRAIELIPERLPDFAAPIGTVPRKNGTEHVFDFKIFLSDVSTDPFLISEFEHIWLAGSLLKLGDVLAQNNYFDRAPELELVRHLRNGIAHGNRFKIDDPQKLINYPAHNRLSGVPNINKMLFEITPLLNGQPVLFDFMGAGDVLDIFIWVGWYLIRMGTGEPLRP